MNTNKTFKRNDEINQEVRMLNASEVTGFTFREGLDKLIVVDGEVVKVASNDYGLVTNAQFFGQFEALLDNAGIKYGRRAINNRNRNFAVDYVLEDESFHVEIDNKYKSAKGLDKVKPMIRAINSYDGSLQTIGQFSAFRQVCENGLHVADLQIGFKVKHRGQTAEVVMPRIDELISQFMNNEFYSLHKKFEVLAESPVSNIEEFVKYVLGKTGLAKYEKSEKNPNEPSKAAQIIIDTMHRESSELGASPNLWLGYNAFNEYIHTANEKIFTKKQEADKAMFNAILEMAN